MAEKYEKNDLVGVITSSSIMAEGYCPVCCCYIIGTHFNNMQKSPSDTTFILPKNQSRIRGVVVSERGETTLEKSVKWAEFDF